MIIVKVIEEPTQIVAKKGKNGQIRTKYLIFCCQQTTNSTQTNDIFFETYLIKYARLKNAVQPRFRSHLKEQSITCQGNVYISKYHDAIDSFDYPICE